MDTGRTEQTAATSPAPPTTAILPEHRSLLPLFIGAAVVLLALAVVVVSQLMGRPPGAQDPTPLPTPTSRPTPSVADTTQPPPPPRLPARVGSYTAVGQPGLHAASYTSLKEYVMVSHLPGSKVADAGLERPHAVGSWTCGTQPKLRVAVCAREAKAGVVVIRGGEDETTLSAFGDQLLAAWK